MNTAGELGELGEPARPGGSQHPSIPILLLVAGLVVLIVAVATGDAGWSVFLAVLLNTAAAVLALAAGRAGVRLGHQRGYRAGLADGARRVAADTGPADGATRRLGLTVPALPPPPALAEPVPRPAQSALVAALVSVPGVAIDPAELAEPVRLPTGFDRAPDSIVDAARLDSLVIRAGAVRGAGHRRDRRFITDTVRLDLIEPFPYNAALSSVATGGATAAASHYVAALACREAAVLVDRDATAIDEAWRAGDPELLRDALRPVLVGIAGRIAELDGTRSLRAASIATQLTCVLSRLGDLPERSHLAFGVGAGPVLRLRDGRWKEIFNPADADADADADGGSGGSGGGVGRDGGGGPAAGGLLPARPDRMHAAVLVTRPGDLLIVATPATAGLLRSPGVAAALAQRWAGQPPNLADFLAHLHIRASGEERDRALVGLWESGQSLAS